MQVQTDSRYELLYPRTNVGQVDGYIKPWKIGDVRITSRTDLSDNWLLCNGNVVSTSDYPLLSENNELLTSGPDTYWQDLGLENYVQGFTKFGDTYYYIYGYSGSAVSIYASSDKTTWTQKWNESTYGYYLQEIHTDDNIYFIFCQSPSNYRGYFYYVQFKKDGTFVKRSSNSKNRHKPASFNEYGRIGFGCDSQYFYRLGDLDTSKGEIPYMYSNNIDTLLVSESGTKVVLTAPTSEDTYLLDNPIFITCYNNKMYAEYGTDKNDSVSMAVFMEFQGASGSCWLQSAVDQQPSWGLTYLDTETGQIASAKFNGSSIGTATIFLSSDGGRNFTEWGSGACLALSAFLYKKGYALTFGYSSANRTSYLNVFTGGANVVNATSIASMSSISDADFNFFDNAFWLVGRTSYGIRYSNLGVALPTYTPADNLSAYIKVKEGE